jgi:uncharacterized protein
MSEPVSLISEWFIKPGCEEDVMALLPELAAEVQANEPGTLTYLIHRPFLADPRLQSLPPVDPLSLLFFETYRDADAFLAHLNGPVFTGFVAEYGDLFLQAGGKPYTTVEFLSTCAGFVRPASLAAAAVETGATGANQHPAVMFEIIANDQAAMTDFYTNVFGWSYQRGTGNFAYVHFPAGSPPLLGGIGQADPGIPGFEPGHNFYLLVDEVAPAVAQAIAMGGSALMEPTKIDGYTFAMIRDPEGNPIGLIEPFSD